MIEFLKNLRKKNGRIKNAFITHFGVKIGWEGRYELYIA